jgi:pimeloyl-ACP methyl ester carboxylesterase
MMKNRITKMNVKVKVIFVIILLSEQLLFAQDIKKKSITIDNIKLSYRTFRLETRKINDPILIFESGVGGGNFQQIFKYLPENIACIEYDRNGLGESGIDTTIQTDAQVIERLHLLLSTVEVKPPYLMVGHSLGGPFIRLYTSKYPNEVCGLVFIDPTDYMLTETENEKAKKATSSLTGYREIWSINMKGMADDASMPAGVRNETKRVLAASSPIYFKEYQNLQPLNDIPVTVIISYNKPLQPYEIDMNKKLNLGINILPWWKAYDNLRIEHYSDLIRNNHHSKMILLPGYSHSIHHQDPSLVADAISEIFTKSLDTDKNNR